MMKKEKLIEWMKKQRNSSHLIRTVAGAYVAYLGGCIFADFFQGEAAGFVLLCCAALLILAGGGIALVSLYAYFNGYSVEYGGRKPWEATEDGKDQSEAAEDE